MDRANLVRMTLRWLVLASVLCQATTPDLLDLSLLSQSLPPGPILAVSNLALCVSTRPSAVPAAAADSAPLEEWLRSVDRGEDIDPDDLCAPFWPELGVMRKHSPRAKPCAGACLPGGPLRPSFAARSSRQHASSTMPALPQDLRCPLTC